MKFPYRMAPFHEADGSGGGAPATPPGDPAPNPAPPTDPAPNPAPANPTPPPDTRSQFIPRERFDEVNGKYRTLQETHNTLSGTYQTAVTERDKAKNEAATATERITQLETALSSMLTARIEALPEDKRDLIPDGLTVEQKLVWLEKAAAKGIFAAPKADPFPIGTPTNPPAGGAVNVANLSPLAMLTAGYGAKR